MIAFVSLRAGDLWPVALAGAVLAIAAIILAYPAQLRALRPAARWIVPAFRVAAMLALAASILRPVLIRSAGPRDRGDILVLMDRSRSMSAVDRLLSDERAPGAVIGQLISIADSLSWLPESEQRQRTSALYDQLARMESLVEDIARARREVEFARFSGRQPGEAQTRLRAAMDEFLGAARDAEARAGAIPASDAAAKLGRLARPQDRWGWISNAATLRQAVAAAREAVDAQQIAADEQSYAADPQVRSVCEELSHLSRLQLSWLTLTATGGLVDRLARNSTVRGFGLTDVLEPLPLGVGDSALNASVDAEAPATDIAASVRAALARTDGHSLQAIIVISDGRQAASSAVRPPVPGDAVPVYTVDAASPRLRDLAIERIEMPSAVFAGEAVTLRVTLRGADLQRPPASGYVVLALEGSAPISRPIVLTHGQVQPVEFTLRLDKPGLQRIDVSVTEQTEEASPQNNVVQRWVKVLSQRLRVTLLAGSSGWDYRYLRDVLERTTWIDLHQAMLLPGDQLAMPASLLADQDLVILSEVSGAMLSAEQWSAIAQLVRRRGGSVIIIPPMNWPPLARGHVLADLVPFSPELVKPAWRTWPGRTPAYHPIPASDEAAAALPLDDDPEISRQRWDELPGSFRYLGIGPLRPAASALLVDRESQAPLLTEMKFGAGRAFFMATSETWRWRDRIGSRDHARFWRQLVRYAVDEPYAAVAAGLSLDVRSAAISPRDSARVRARLRPQTGRPLPASLELLVLQQGAVIRTQLMKPLRDSGDGRYVADLDALPRGEYQLRVAGPSDGAPAEHIELPLLVREDIEPEMADLRPDRAALRALADATGGRYLRLDQLHLLPGLLEQSRREQPPAVEMPLWYSGYMLTFVLACFTAEWALRKRLGLA